jgi:hypothetical protein
MNANNGKGILAGMNGINVITATAIKTLTAEDAEFAE